MTIEWIPVTERVPDDRRRVLAWTENCLFRSLGPWLQVTQFNPTKRGGRFDCEVSGFVTVPKVTHWAEITAPSDCSTPRENEVLAELRALRRDLAAREQVPVATL
jgi:hypothetical protein